MSKCPISWNVHVETGHNYFFTQEAFNKYNKPETYEEKIAKRHALFPLQQSHIGSNPGSKRSLKKQLKEIVRTVPKVQSLSDESDDDDIFGSTSADLDEFGIGPPEGLKKEEKKTKKRRSNQKDVVLEQKVLTDTEKIPEDTEQVIIATEIDIGELEEFGVDKNVTHTVIGGVSGRTSKDDAVAEKKRKQEKSDDLEKDNDLEKDKVNDEEKSTTHTETDQVDTKTSQEKSFGEVIRLHGNSTDLEKVKVSNGKLQADNKIQTKDQKECQEKIHDSIEDLEEFGVEKNSKNKKKEELIEPVKEEIDDVHTKEKNKSLHEEFPWDNKYRERKSEKYDLYKYQNRKSNLTSREQSRYLLFHSRFGYNTPRNPSQKVKNEMKEFSELHEKVAEEQKEFQQYLERLAQTMRAEYNYLAPEADRYYKERLALKRKKVQLYPKYYNVIDKLNLSTIGPPCQLLFVRSLLEMGSVPKLMLPSMEIGERPRIPIDYDSIVKHCPCIHSKSLNIWNHEPCSQDQNCSVLSKQHKVHITISASAIGCLVNNHAPSYSREWEVPFTVRDYELQEGDKKFMHRVVYIDNPLPAKELTGRDKNTTFYKYALRSHMGRFNQKGHVFSANQKVDHDHQEASELPRQQSSASQLHGLSSPSHRQENDIPFLSPLKSPQIRKVQKKKEKLEIKDEVTEEDDDDPFGTMEVSMEDLETFGTDLSKIKKSKIVEETQSSLLDNTHSIQDKETDGKLSKHSGKEGEKQEASTEDVTTISNQSDTGSRVEFKKNGDNKTIDTSLKNIELNENEETVNSSTVLKPVLGVTGQSKKVTKFVMAETEHVLDMAKPEQGVTLPEQEVSSYVEGDTTAKQEVSTNVQGVTKPVQEVTAYVKEVTKPEQEPTNLVQEVSTHMQEVASNKQEVSTHLQEVSTNVQDLVIKHVQKETEQTDGLKPTQVVKMPVQPVIDLKSDIDINNTASHKDFELQISSASDDESDALIIDEPEEVKGQSSKLYIEETPASPTQKEICIEAPSSPLPDTPLSPTKTVNSPNTSTVFTTPISPSKCSMKSICSTDNTDSIMSPERADRSSPTSPVKHSSPFGQLCKIIPLQRESEEENVIDNSNITTYQESRLNETHSDFGLRPKRRRSVKKHLIDSDSVEIGKLSTSPNAVSSDLISSATSVVSNNESDSTNGNNLDKISVACPSVANEDQESNCDKELSHMETDSSVYIEPPKLIEDSGESSDEVVSPRSKICKKNKKSRNDSDFLSPRRRPRVIDSDSDNDDQTTAKMNTEFAKEDNSELINENIGSRGNTAQMKRNHRNSTDSEIHKEQDKQSYLPSQRKRQKSGKGQSSVEKELTDINLEEIACMRRKTRSVVGTRKKDQSFESQEIPEKISVQKRTKSLDDVATETVSMITRRQTRQSLDSVSDVKRSDKLAILDRMKQSLRLTSKEDPSVDKQPECQIVAQKRKRGRPPKVKSTRVRSITPDTECTGSNTDTLNKVTEISDKNIEIDDKQTEIVKSTNNKVDEIEEGSAAEPMQTDKSVTNTEFTSGDVTKEILPIEGVFKNSEKGQEVHKDAVNNSMETSIGQYGVETNSSFMKTGKLKEISPNLTDQNVVQVTERDQNVGQMNESSKCKADNKDTTMHAALEVKDNVKEQTVGVYEKYQSHKPDHTKKTRPIVTAGQRTQQPKTSVNPLENIMQAQEKLLDNPKHHLDKAQQEYFSQFKFPERHNITYHLWSLGAYNVMVRCGYHGVYKDASQKVSFVHVSPKMEYQVEHGLEQITASEISKEWATAYVRPNCKIVRVRINPLQSEVVSMKEEELSKMHTSAHGFNQANGFQMLANVFHRLHQCSPGQYLLQHTPGSSECQIKKSTDNNKRGSYDLHMDYFGFMGGEKTSNHIPWIPVDPNYIQQRFHKKGRIPATFEPRDYKQAMHKKKKKKKHS